MRKMEAALVVVGLLGFGIIVGRESALISLAVNVEQSPQKQLTGIAAVPLSDSYDGCDSCSILARQLAWSLDHQSDWWTTNGYRMMRKDGPSIWVANGENSITVGPTPASTGGGPPLDKAADRALLYRAYNRWLQAAIIKGSAAAAE